MGRETLPGMEESIGRYWCTRWTPTGTGGLTSAATTVHLASSVRTSRWRACQMTRSVLATATGLAARSLKSRSNASRVTAWASEWLNRPWPLCSYLTTGRAFIFECWKKVMLALATKSQRSQMDPSASPSPRSTPSSTCRATRASYWKVHCGYRRSAQAGITRCKRYCVLSARMRSLVLKRRNTGQFAVCSSKGRSEEHTSELQSLRHLVCRLLLEKKKKQRSLLLEIKKKNTKKTSTP